MYFVVETAEQLKLLKSFCKDGCYFYPILGNDNFHPALSELVAVYIRPTGTESTGEDGGYQEIPDKGYIIPISHKEGLSVSKESVLDILQHASVVYVLNKKQALYHFVLGKNSVDLSLKYSMSHYGKLDIWTKEKTYNWFYNRYGGKDNLNRIIPLPKLYEKCEEVYNRVKGIISEKEPEGFYYYNELATKAFFMVEQEGLRVDVHEFEKQFKPLNTDFSIKGETVYTSYNLYNATSRPTNSFNSINFLAIPKEDIYRRCFKPKGKKFVEIDYDGFHLRLVANLVGYELNTVEKAHKQLANLRKTKEENYQKIKAENFKMIYGSPSEEDSSLEFSKKIQSYIRDLWNGFITNKYLKDPYTSRVFTDELSDMYPQKLFNYTIQSLETSRNILVLCKVLRYLSQYKTKVVLITYDSFLLDVAEGEDKVVDGIKNIMETGGFPVEIKESNNFIF